MATRLVVAGILFYLISSGLVILAVSSLLRRGENMGEEDSASLQEEPDLRSAAAGYARQITGEAGFRHAAETVYRCSMTNAKQTSARAAAWDCVITKGKEEQEKAQAPPVKERLGGFWNFRKKKGKASAENLKAAANDGNFQKASGSHLKETTASEKIIYSLQKELPSLESLVKARGAGVIIYHTTGTESPLSIFPLNCFIIRAENKA
jgi:hypothetical protein